jgi:hypothetical protein
MPRFCSVKIDDGKSGNVVSGTDLGRHRIQLPVESTGPDAPMADLLHGACNNSADSNEREF